ncbi:MAG: ATP-binding cassette domain-containing protein [Halobacteriovoraceae bacterium]|nr:ATP-binding cassette domain-containing protein [Halobacteriovoraceae bacterium]MCB9095146.1 ATP-binding cassette domain-containing protein [Halobacteriovoraceae bacterium]
MIESHLLESLPSESIITLLPQFKKTLFEKAQVQLVSLSDKIGTFGESLSELIIPLDGDLVLYKKNQKNEDMAFGFLQKGRCLGLGNIISGTPLTYEARGESNIRVLKLSKKDFLEYLESYPEYLNYLKLMTSSMAIRNFKRFLVGSGIKIEDIVKVFSKLKKTSIVDQASLMNLLQSHILFIDSGKLEIYFDDKDKIAHSIEEGGWIGGESIVPPHILSYSIGHSQNIESLYYLSHQDLKPILSDNTLNSLYQEPFLNLFEHHSKRVFQEKSPPWGENCEPISSQKNSMPNWGKLEKATSDFKSFSANLKNLGSIYNLPINVSFIENYIKFNMKDLNLKVIAELLEVHGFQTHPNKFQENIRPDFPLVSVLGNRLVLIHAIELQTLYYYDACYGFQKKNIKDQPVEWLELSESWKKARNVLNEENPWGNKNNRKVFNEIFKNTLFERKDHIWKIVLSSVFLVVLSLLVPYIYGNSIDSVFTLGKGTNLSSDALIICLCAFGTFIFSYLQKHYLSEYFYKFRFKTSAKFYKKILGVNLKSTDKNREENTFIELERFTKFQRFIEENIFEIGAKTVLALFSLILISLYGRDFFIISIVFVILVYFSVKTLGKEIDIVQTSRSNSETKMKRLVSEIVTGIMAIKIFNSEKIFLENFEKKNNEKMKAEKWLANKSVNIQIFFRLIQGGLILSTMSVAITQYFESKLSLGDVFAISLYGTIAASPLMDLIPFILNMNSFKMDHKYSKEYFNKNNDEHFEIRKVVKKMKGHIELERVKFRYDKDEQWTLNNISLNIFPKQKVAIVGESGCGKTTLANLIAGNIFPQSGRLYYDGIDSSLVSQKSLDNQIGFIEQESCLFTGSIKENIAYAYPDVSDAKVIESAEEAYCSEFITEFPHMYEQELAEGGRGLSGGQKQRLSIARTIYRDPQILILDEATSGLDSDSEYKIVELLKKFGQEKTFIFITHRYSTIRLCDYIFLMEKGEIVDQGSVDELFKTSLRFKKLFQEQLS